MYSSEESFFSKKRIESGIAFIIGQVGMLTWFFKHIHNMDYIEIIAWSSVEFAMAGYMIKELQKEKTPKNEQV